MAVNLREPLLALIVFKEHPILRTCDLLVWIPFLILKQLHHFVLVIVSYHRKTSFHRARLEKCDV